MVRRSLASASTSRRSVLRSGALLAAGRRLQVGRVTDTAPDTTTVLTQNLYLGSALGPALQAGTAAAFEETVDRIYRNVLDSRFEERARGLAAEIAAVEPDVVGLQEAARFVDRGESSNSRDHLETLVGALEAEGLSYTEAASVETFDAEFSVTVESESRDVRFTNSDVVLAREGVETSAEDTGTYYTGGRELGIGRGYCSVTVEDAYTFVNTHLSTPRAPILQLAQASELLVRFRDPPTVLVGDFNSGPTTDRARAYDLLTERYTDAYAAANPEKSGETCCQQSTLTNEESALERRIDHVFTHGELTTRRAERVAHDRSARVDGRWPSDHAGVMAELALP